MGIVFGACYFDVWVRGPSTVGPYHTPGFEKQACIILLFSCGRLIQAYSIRTLRLIGLGSYLWLGSQKYLQWEQPKVGQLWRLQVESQDQS